MVLRLKEPLLDAFTLEKKEFEDLYIGKEECEVIQKVGKILEIRILDETVFYMPLSEQAKWIFILLD